MTRQLRLQDLHLNIHSQRDWFAVSGELLDEVLKIAKIIRLEVHAPASEIEKLREQLASLNPQFFVLDEGIRRTSEA